MAVVACGGDAVTVPAPDKTPPIVVWMSPQPSTTAATTTDVTAYFSEEMNMASLTSGLTLDGPSGPVTGTVDIGADARSATFHPASLDAGTMYTATISGGAQDLAGNAIGAEVSWSFTTGPAPDTMGPTVTAVTPPDGASVQASTMITATLSEVIDCASTGDDSLQVFERTTRVPGFVTCSQQTLTYHALAGLPTNTELTALVDPTVHDLAGNPLAAARTWTFAVAPWTRQIASSLFDQGFAMATDPAGNVYVAAVTAGNVDGNVNAGGNDVVVVAYDVAGAHLWTRAFATSGDDEAGAIAADAAGNVYVAGFTAGNLGGNTNAGLTDAFVAKLDHAGTVMWTKLLGTNQPEMAFGVAIDSQGNVFVGGRTGGGLDGNTNAGLYDVFIAKLDATGNKLWTRQIGSSENDFINGISVDGAGRVYGAGVSAGAFDGGTNAGGADVIFVAYDGAGTKLWTRQLGTSGEDVTLAFAADDAGGLYAVGQTTGNLDGNGNAGGADAFVVKYDSSGVKQWIRQRGSASTDTWQGVATDGTGRVYVVGFTDGSFDGHASSGLSDAIVLAYDSSGDELWSRQPGTPGNDLALGAAADAAGNIYTTITSEAAFDGYANDGGLDVFAVRYDRDGSRR